MASMKPITKIYRIPAPVREPTPAPAVEPLAVPAKPEPVKVGAA